MSESPASALPPHGVLAHSRVWRDGVCVDDDVTPAEMLDLARDPQALVWLDLLRPSQQGLEAIARDLNLPWTAVEDALAPHERAKVTRHESHLFFTVYTARLRAAQPGQSGRLEVSRISGIVLPMALVTIRLDDGVDLDEVMRRWEEGPELLRHGSGALVYGLLDFVVDGHFDTIQEIDDETERIEDLLFEDRPMDRSFQRAVYGLRKDLVQLRRVVLPMREVVNGVLRHAPTAGALGVWYDDLYDHVLRASEWTESLRDMVASIFETNLSLTDARLNTIMKKLAGWAAIIAVPTLITSWYGQNIPYPGFSDPTGLYACIALIVVSTVGLYLVFKRQDWL